jgi:RNA polymerase-binding transcription factor DksA
LKNQLRQNYFSIEADFATEKKFNRQRDEEKLRADELAHLAKISSMLVKGHAGCGAELALTLKDENKWPRNVELSNMYSMMELNYRCCHRCGGQIYWPSKSTKKD